MWYLFKRPSFPQKIVLDSIKSYIIAISSAPENTFAKWRLRTDISNCPFEQKLKSYTSFYFSVFLRTIFVFAFAPSCVKYFKIWENVFPLHLVSYVIFKKPRETNVPIQCVNNIWSKQEYKWCGNVMWQDLRSQYQMMTSIAYQNQDNSNTKANTQNEQRKVWFWLLLTDVEHNTNSIVCNCSRLNTFGSGRINACDTNL